MTSRAELHRFIDAIPETAIEGARRALEPLVDDFLLALAEAETDDEPETEDERRQVAEARADVKAGRVRDSETERR
ncbi:MAG: hypothetical protein U0821_18195 [Chloroflexota bacterium]